MFGISLIGGGLDLISLWFGVTVIYIVGGALVIGGIVVFAYFGEMTANPLARLFRIIGVILMVLGIAILIFNVGKSTGAVDCQAAWKAKNYEEQIARLQQEAAAKKIAADTASQQADQLASQNDDLQKQVTEYQDAAKNSAACRHATDDDVRRLCELTGNSAPGCANPK